MKKAIVKTCLALLPGMLLFSCATTSKNRYQRVDEAVAQGDYRRAVTEIDNAQTPPGNRAKAKEPIYTGDNTILMCMDKGILEYYAGDYRAAIEDFQEAERLIEEAYTKSISEGIASYIKNDNSKSYAGEDYESLYADLFRALALYAEGDNQNALAQARNISGKLQNLIGEYNLDGAGDGKTKTPGRADMMAHVVSVLGALGLNVNIDVPEGKTFTFKDSVLARYLSTILLRGEGGINSLDQARFELFSLNQAYAAAPEVYTNPLPAALKTAGSRGREAAEELDIPGGKARLNIIGFAGLSPEKVEDTRALDLALFPVLGSLRIFDSAKTGGDGGIIYESRLLTYGKLALPRLENRPSEITRVEAVIDDQTIPLDILEDMGAVMREVFLAKYNATLVKTFARCVIKYASIEVSANIARSRGVNDAFVFATALISKKGVDNSEDADIRAARYFPGKAYVAGINLDPGEYDITINYYGGTGAKIDSVVQKVNVQIGKANIVGVVCLK